MISHIIDILPFTMALVVILVGPRKVSFKRPLTIAVMFVTGAFLLAQSSWFTAMMTGDNWGREWANYVWFFFNTGVMGVFLCILFCKE